MGVGDTVGFSVGKVGSLVGLGVGDLVGRSVGESVGGDVVGASVGAFSQQPVDRRIFMNQKLFWSGDAMAKHHLTQEYTIARRTTVSTNSCTHGMSLTRLLRECRRPVCRREAVPCSVTFEIQVLKMWFEDQIGSEETKIAFYI